MTAKQPKRKNEQPIYPAKRKGRPKTPTTLYVAGGVVGVIVILVLGIGLGLALRQPASQLQSASLPTLAAGDPTQPVTSERATLPPTWTPTDTPQPSPTSTMTPIRPTPTITETSRSEANTEVPPGNNPGFDDPSAPISLASDVTGKKIIIDVDSLPLHVWPDESFQTIEYAVRGAVRTILVEGQGYDDQMNPEIWWYIADGYGWIPSEIDGKPTARDYSPEMLDTMIAETDQRMRDQRGDYTLHLQKGWMLYGQQDYGSAISEITVAIEMSKSANQEDARLYEYRGKVYLDMKDFVNAFRNFDQAIALGLEEGSTYNRRAIAYKGLKQFDEAMQDYLTAIKLNPKYGLLYNNVGALLADQNKFDPSQVDWYGKAIQADNAFPYAYSNRATYYRISGDYTDHVINDYTVALSYLPNDVEILNNRGTVYSHRGDILLARNDYNRVIEIDPTYINGYMNRGVDYWSTGEQKKAIADLLTALHIDPNSDAIYYNLGTMLHQVRQYEAAIYCYNRALEINPDRRDAQINRAQLYEMLGGLDETKIMAYANVELLITPIP